MPDAAARVLVVDDERAVREGFADALDDEFGVLTASDGEAALERLDETVDVVLLDRQMPGRSGGDVLDDIRSEDVDCCVCMVTGVEPELDILEMGFDDYVVKPVDRAELVDVVESLLARPPGATAINRALSLAAKQSALEDARADGEAADRPKYREFRAHVDDVGDRVGAPVGQQRPPSDGPITRGATDRTHEACPDCGETTFALVSVEDVYEIVCSNCGRAYGDGFVEIQ